MNLETRAPLEVDREALRTIHHAAYRDLSERAFGAWQEERQDQYFDDACRRSPPMCIFADGELAGFVSVQRLPQEHIVDELVIDPRLQGRGIGSSMLTRLMAEATERRVTVRLRTHHQNRAAALYERLGFVQTGSTETHRLYEWSPKTPSRPTAT